MSKPKRDSSKKAPGQEFLTVGTIKGHWGTGGFLKVKSQTDFPDRFQPGERLYLSGKPLLIEDCRPYKDILLIKLKSIDTAETARALNGKSLDIPLSDARPLPEGEYYRFQLMGLDVVSTTNEAVGRISEILPTASNDVYVVRGESKKDILIPAISDVVKSIDLETNRMVIEVIDGLID